MFSTPVSLTCLSDRLSSKLYQQGDDSQLIQPPAFLNFIITTYIMLVSFEKILSMPDTVL